MQTLAAFPNYTFGLDVETVEPARNPLDIDAETDEDGEESDGHAGTAVHP